MRRMRKAVCLLGIGGILAGAQVSFAEPLPSPVTWYERGIAVLAAYRGDDGVLQRARGIFSRIVARYPSSPLGYLGLSRMALIEAYRYGDHYDMSLLKEKALPAAERALELGPLLPAAHDHYARFEKIYAAHLARQREARERLERDPTDPETFTAIAEFFWDRHELSRAAVYYETALDLAQDDATRIRILHRLAVLYLDGLRLPERAAEACRRIRLFRPDDPQALEMLGRSYLESRDYERAVPLLEEAWKRRPLPGILYARLLAQGYRAVESGRRAEGIAFLQQAARYRPHDIDVQFTLGEQYYRLSLFREAYRHFKKVVEMSTDDPRALYFAGRSADSMGERDLATTYYRRYLRLRTDSREARWVRERLRSRP